MLKPYKKCFYSQVLDLYRLRYPEEVNYPLKYADRDTILKVISFTPGVLAGYIVYKISYRKLSVFDIVLADNKNFEKVITYIEKEVLPPSAKLFAIEIPENFTEWAVELRKKGFLAKKLYDRNELSMISFEKTLESSKNTTEES